MNDKEYAKYALKMEKEPEVFKVGTAVKWQGGEERGAFINFGIITKLIGKPFSGQLECTFINNKNVQTKLFKKSDGSCIDDIGYISFI